MYKIIITTFLIFSFFYGKSQTSTWGNPDYISYYSKFLNKIDTPQIKGGDFEIRLWFNNGGNKIKTICFVSLAKLTNSWDVSYYTFTSFFLMDSIIVHKEAPIKLNYDSLFNQLNEEGLFKLNSDSMNVLMDKKGQHIGMWTDAGPTNYTIQIVTTEKRWVLNYKCPRYFYYEAKIDEFKVPLKVISTLLQLIGLKPC